MLRPFCISMRVSAADATRRRACAATSPCARARSMRKRPRSPPRLLGRRRCAPGAARWSRLRRRGAGLARLGSAGGRRARWPGDCPCAAAARLAAGRALHFLGGKHFVAVGGQLGEVGDRSRVPGRASSPLLASAVRAVEWRLLVARCAARRRRSGRAPRRRARRCASRPRRPPRRPRRRLRPPRSRVRSPPSPLLATALAAARSCSLSWSRSDRPRRRLVVALRARRRSPPTSSTLPLRRLVGVAAVALLALATASAATATAAATRRRPRRHRFSLAIALRDRRARRDALAAGRMAARALRSSPLSRPRPRSPIPC